MLDIPLCRLSAVGYCHRASFSFGIYEFFSYSVPSLAGVGAKLGSVPGGLQILVVTYILERLGWADTERLLELPSLLLLALGLGASLMAGNMLYPVSLRLVRGSHREIVDAERALLQEQSPEQRGRPFLSMGFRHPARR